MESNVVPLLFCVRGQICQKLSETACTRHIFLFSPLMPLNKNQRFFPSLIYKKDCFEQNIQKLIFKLMSTIQQSNIQTAKTLDPHTPNQSKHQSTNNNNKIFAVLVILFEILALPIYGVLFKLSDSLSLYYDDGGVLLIAISSILLLAGFGLINAYITKYSLSAMGYTLLIFALTIQHFFLFRAFWSKAGASDYEANSKTFSTWYNFVTISNYGNDRQVTSLLPSGPLLEAIACSISLSVAFSSLAGKIGLAQIFVLTIFGTFFYQVNAQLIYRWFITDNGYGCRIFLFGSILGLTIALFLWKQSKFTRFYKSQYRTMSLSLLGFIFVCVSFPSLSCISIFTKSGPDNAVLYATQINTWLAVFSSVLGTFTASALFYRKFSVFDLIFSGTAGAISLGMQADISFNPAVPLIVGYLVGFFCSIWTSAFHRSINKNSIIFTYPIINRFIIPAIISSIVSAVVQACAVSINGDHPMNRLSVRTEIQQGGWQIVGFLLTAGIALLAGVIIGVLMKFLNKHQQGDYFDDGFTYENIPKEE